ncbi:MAG: hypothetical protein D8M28_04860 [Proteobacteria bacterium]|nr:hypothetical protein [Pseudomonadota bacterium]
MKMRVLYILVLPVLLVWVLTAVALAQEPVRLDGVPPDTPLYRWLSETVIEKYKNRELPEGAEPSIRYAGIRRDAEKALHAKGYYRPEISFTAATQNVLKIDAGPLYTIAAIKLEGIDGVTVEGIAAGDALEAEKVLAAQKKLAAAIRKEKCVFRLKLRNEVVLDHDSRSAEVSFVADAGQSAVFGDTVFEGAPFIDDKHLRRFVKYKQGDCWDAAKIEATKAALIGTGLISTVNEVLPEVPDENGTVAVRFVLRETARRTLLLGGSFYTDEGPGLTAEWRHRNFFGSGEELSLGVNGNFLEQAASAVFAKPYFMRDDQKLKLSSTLGREDTDAYEKLSFKNTADVERKLSGKMTAALGTGFEISRIRDETTTLSRNFALFSLSGQLAFDDRDDKLDPKKGMFFKLRSEPNLDLFGEADPFLKSTIEAATYFGLDQDRDTILAVRGKLGSILGSGTGNIPASKRFHAGGSGSVRGFGYQEAGPVAANGDPLGGRSVLETSAELRFKLKEKIGGAVFIDGGGAYDAEFPDFQGGYYIGAGVGARYYTDFGPLRFDLAVPLNNRDQTQRNWQFYISIGQAF